MYLYKKKMKKKTLISEVRQLQKIAGILKEERTPGLQRFLELVAKNIYTAGMEDVMIGDIQDWDTLFEYWEDHGGLSRYTQSDILHLAKKASLSPQEIDYIMDLPEVADLEKGDLDEAETLKELKYPTPNLDVLDLFGDSEDGIEDAVAQFVEKYLDTNVKDSKHGAIRNAESVEEVEELLGKQLPVAFTLVLGGDYSDYDTIYDLEDGYYLYAEGYNGGIIGILSKAGLAKLVKDLKAAGAKPYREET